MAVIRAFIISVVLILLMAWTVGGSETFQTCVQKNEHQNIAGLIASVDAYRNCVGHFVHQNGEGIVAAFTVILAFSTIFLWFATRDLVKEAKMSSEMELRAYVVIDNAIISAVKAGATPEAEIVIKNGGQTPAHSILTWVAIGYVTLPASRHPRDESDLDAGSVSVLGPGGIYKIGGKLSGALTNDDYAALLDPNGGKAIHVLGGVAYRDAFGQDRKTYFNAFCGGPYGIEPSGALSHGQTGNEAT